ncbi:MAG: PIG-L deacetylase family protein [Promethearchaeati archaeon]
MKIIIFEPHPDDLLFGPGPILLDWIKENHNIHIITVTDGRACYRSGEDSYSDDVATMTEDDVAEMRINEAKKAIEFLGIPHKNHHLLKFHDAEGQEYVSRAIEKVKPLIEDAERLVFPSDNNKHDDHQATHDIAVGAAQDLNLKSAEYFIYAIPSYVRFSDDSIQKQLNVKISEEKAKKLMEWYQIYNSQHKIKFTNKMYLSFLKNVRERTYAIFKYDDIGKYKNF